MIRNFILLGMSGSAKGTQAQLLMEKIPNLYHLSTGDLMRDLAKLDTDAGHRVKKVLDEGGLIPDVIAMTMWTHNLIHELKSEQGLIADGFPRRLVEAQSLDRFLEWLERKDSTKIVLIDVSREEATKRLKLRARSDDNDADIKNRLDWFEKEVMEVVKFYEGQGRLIRVNGEQTIEQVFSELWGKLT